MPKSEEALLMLVQKRERLFQRLQVTFDLIARLPETQEVFLTRANNAIDSFKNFEEIQDDISKLVLTLKDNTVPVNSVSEAYEALHFQILSKAKNIKDTQAYQQRVARDEGAIHHETTKLRPKLPPLEIPKFKGDFEQFPAFRSLFDSLVHKTSLSSIQKFSFLKTYLEPPALHVIENFELNELNYELAYQKLIDRYTDKRLVGTYYLNKLFNSKPLINAKNLGGFLDTFVVYYESLKALCIPNLSEFMIFYVAMKVVDEETRQLFEVQYAKESFPTFDNLVKFIRELHKVASLSPSNPTKSHGLSNYQSSSSGMKSSKMGTIIKGTTKSLVVKTQETPKNSRYQSSEFITICRLCQGAHSISTCPGFQNMNPEQRHETIKSFKLCFNCLGPHIQSACSSRYNCRICKTGRHHTLLHREIKMGGVNSAEIAATDRPSSSGTSTNVLNCRIDDETPVVRWRRGLLGTARGRIISRDGQWIPCRMVIDPASESSFITERMVQNLKLPRSRCEVDILGVGANHITNPRGIVNLKISPVSNNHMLHVEAMILSKISSQMPQVELDPSIRMRFAHLALADPHFDRPDSVDILIGVRHYSEVLSEDLIHIKGNPAALNTIFGFVLFGQLPNEISANVTTSMFTCLPALDYTLQKFWELEEPKPILVENPEDVFCEKLFKQTTSRDVTGRYQVALPFKFGKLPENLGSTREIAYKRVMSLEKRLLKNPDAYQAYNEILFDYLQQEHMREAEQTTPYIMTHHAVTKESTTTKVRVVFNASEQSTSSSSLNQCLYAGPKLQSDISTILLKFRLNPIVLTADIKQMYRSIRVYPKHSLYTHFLWRFNQNTPIKEWEITTLPFGLSCSPYLAQRVLRQLFIDEGNPYPLAKKYIPDSLYVDDIVTSVSSEGEAILLYQEASNLFQKGGFCLRKFSSNSAYVLKQIPESHQERALSFGDSSYVKLLGLHWDPNSDNFFYKLNLDKPLVTKRGLLSQVARIYDIQGYLAPITFWIKHLLQQIWLEKLDWDDRLPDEMAKEWVQFYNQLPMLQTISIPRFTPCLNAQTVDIIGFCDASEKGYAANLYLRVQYGANDVRKFLIKAKSKVASLKNESIPRLELNGALLLAKLIESIEEFRTSLPGHEILCFTDSRTVLSWLRTPLHRLKIYVANRISPILNTVPLSMWYHIPGSENAADVASRGSHPSTLVDNKLWWEGPPFLDYPKEHWPEQNFIPLLELPDIKNDINTLVSREDDRGLIKDLITHYSSYERLLRILSLVILFIKRCRRKADDSEINSRSIREQALRLLIVQHQREYFYDLLNLMEKQKPIKGPLRRLTPFFDDHNIIRVGGRLRNSSLPYTSRHPILLSRKGRLALLICESHHRRTLHGGPLLMQSLILRQFWIPGMRYLTRSVVYQCSTCYRYKAQPLKPLMSDVPSMRFQEVRAFVNVGVDLAGPFLLKESKRRNARSSKSWMVIFICLATRALYLDYVSEISSSAFLAALDRFIARRGCPSQMYSDRGTNFIGAARELKEVVEELVVRNSDLAPYCLERKIEWFFNPPGAPHFGGSWESGVKSAKHHLKRTIGQTPITSEEFRTILARIEGILNSRPLCPLSDNPNDGYDFLTPGHFLMGAPPILNRVESNNGDRVTLNGRWHIISRCIQDFWKRWSVEYLHTLVPRFKWTDETVNLAEGTSVILIDQNLPPNQWKLGIVREVLPGPDGIVRVAKLKTTQGEVVRPVTKLALFPPQPNQV